MYEWLSAAASAAGAPCVRGLARQALRLASAIAPVGTTQPLRREIMGLSFPGPIGLAAGFDKHGELYPCLSRLGFGFAEIGSVIPKAEVHRSLGLEAVADRISGIPHPIPLGVSISMNRATPVLQMPEDYLACMRRLWLQADYMTINLGVRAGPDLHLPQHRHTLDRVLAAVKESQSQLTRQHGIRRPLLVKVDIRRGKGCGDAILDVVAAHDFDGVVISGEHGLSGESTVLTQISRMAACMTVIAVGGIQSGQDAATRLAAGASLVQIYGALVKLGPLVPRRMNRVLASALPSG